MYFLLDLSELEIHTFPQWFLNVCNNLSVQCYALAEGKKCYYAFNSANIYLYLYIYIDIYRYQLCNLNYLYQ